MTVPITSSSAANNTTLVVMLDVGFFGGGRFAFSAASTSSRFGFVSCCAASVVAAPFLGSAGRAPTSFVPHAWQNLASRGTSASHFGHLGGGAIAAPHALQKLAPARFGVAHSAQLAPLAW